MMTMALTRASLRAKAGVKRNAHPLQQCRSLQTTRSSDNAKKDLLEYFHYSKVVVGSQANITEKFAKNALRFCEQHEPIDLERARFQHRNHVKELSRLIPQVVTVPAVSEFPDQIFVEDPAVVLDGVAFITRMRPPTRAGEPQVIKPVLEELGLNVVEMNDPDAHVEGGDVLFTGREILVGLSKRTNAVRHTVIITLTILFNIMHGSDV